MTSEDVLLFCIRVVVYDYVSNLRSRFRPSQNSVNERARISALSKGSQTSSVIDIFSSGNFNKEKKKFPKELIKAFEEALKKVIMRQEPAYDDVLLRGTFGAFYAYYVSDAFQKSMKDNRKIEDIILMFYSKATAELQKRVAETENKELVIAHIAKFVRLLLQTVRSHKLASNDSDLVLRLAEYEKRLLQNPEYVAPAGKYEQTIHCEEPTIVMRVQNSPLLQKLAVLFEKSPERLQSLVDATIIEATDEALLRDLKLLLEQISSQTGIMARKDDFRDETSYTAWRQKEVAEITSRVLKLTNANPDLARTSRDVRDRQEKNARSRANSFSSDASHVPNRFSALSIGDRSSGRDSAAAFFFIPMDPFAAYTSLIQIMLDKDEHHRIVDAEEPQRLISKEAAELLAQCQVQWRISSTAHKVAFIHASCLTFLNGKLTLEELDVAFFEVESYSLSSDLSFFKSMESLYSRDLSALHEALFRDLYGELQNVYNDKIDLQILTFMEEYIYADPCFAHVASQSANMFDELEKSLRLIAEQRYGFHRDNISTPLELEILHIVRLANTLCKDITTYQKRYPKPLLDVIDVWTIYLQITLPQFLHDLKPLLEQCYRNVKAQGADFAIEDMFDLYRSVSEVLKILQKNKPDFHSPVNVDLYFRPYILKWLQQANTTVMSLVPKVLDGDDFSPQQLDTHSGDCNSESITLLFKSFTQHLAYLRNLRWPDEYWSAKFITILTHTFSNAIKEYCISIQQLFDREFAMIAQETDSSGSNRSTLQKKLLAKARDALSKHEPPEPLNISSSACVKLNNIVSAKNYLNVLEASVDSASLTSILEKYEAPTKSWSSGQMVMFSIKVISAQDIIISETNGFNDAYVVLSDQRGRRIGKTRSIYTNSYPQWDESFDIGTQDSMWLAATVWDRSGSGEHDVRGRCYFKLDPVSFVDMIPREMRIALDTQGDIHLRITMELETDESTFYFARAFRFLRRAEADMSRSIVERMIPFIDAALSRHNLQSIQFKSSTIDTTLGSAYGLLSKAGFSSSRTSAFLRESNHSITNQDIEAPVEPLMRYLDDNFRTLDGTLNRAAFLSVLSRLWDHVLGTIENMIVPQLSAKRHKSKKALTENELDACYKWLGFLKDTFGGDGGGLSQEELQTVRYHELLSIRFFYFDDIEDLMSECERMATIGAAKMKQAQAQPLFVRKAYNLGTIKQNRDDKRAYQRSLATSEDIILRVLRLRGDSRAQEYVHARIRVRARELSLANATNIARQPTIHSKAVSHVIPC